MQTMAKKKAYKKSYGFLSTTRAEKYSLFLKENLLNLNPKYYVVVGQKRVNTPDGEMFALRITTDIEFPNFEPIAECWINGSDIYLWRDKCWGIAVDEEGKEIKKLERITKLVVTGDLDTARQKPINKTVLLFPIGVDEIE